MPKKPPVHELAFLKLTSNHAEFGAKLTRLGIPTTDLVAFAQHIGEAWFRLGEQHLDEAKKAHAAGCERAGFSRAYYAAYNASKSVRYLVRGLVSLRSDDHEAASGELPEDFPEVAEWARTITVLYEHRLRADYDNWATTGSEHSLTPADAIAEADEFINVARSYINTKFGMKL